MMHDFSCIFKTQAFQSFFSNFLCILWHVRMSDTDLKICQIVPSLSNFSNWLLFPLLV